MHHDITNCVICISDEVGYLELEGRELQKFYQRGYIVTLSDLRNAMKKTVTLNKISLHTHLKESVQTSKFSMTSFCVTSFICSSVRATLTIFSMASALAQKLAC